MATFEARVEGLTGLAVTSSSSPTQNELTEFLKDGTIDVTERVIVLRPQEAVDFTRESSEITSQAGIQVNGARIISVVRETGTNIPNNPAAIIFNIIDAAIKIDKFISLNHN